jgi:hypothetical protein
MKEDIKRFEIEIDENKTLFFDSEKQLSGNIPFPRSLVRVDLNGNFDIINAFDSAVFDLKITDEYGSSYKSKAIVKWQGSSSLGFPKKNFRIDLISEDENSVKVRFGKWVATDSYDIKVNWTDVTQAKNVACARIVYAIDTETYSPETRFPWWPKVFGIGSENSDLLSRFDSGARCVIDGFPVEIYINGLFYGIGTWNLKKDRANMQMSKNNQNQVWAEMVSTGFEYPVTWAGWEIRNPSGTDEGAEMPTGSAKTAFLNFLQWLNATQNFKAEAGQHLYIDKIIDYFILSNIWYAVDSINRNMQLCTWDAQHWTLCWYDMDAVLGTQGAGVGYFNAPSGFISENKLMQKIHTLYWNETKDRYAELRKKYITVEYHEAHLREIIDIFGFDAYEKDFERWPELAQSAQGSLSIYFLIDWLKKRIDYCDILFGYTE